MSDKPYDEKRRCPKCGQAATTRSMRNLGLRRDCMRCGHCWWERPLDELAAEPPPGKLEEEG